MLVTSSINCRITCICIKQDVGYLHRTRPEERSLVVCAEWQASADGVFKRSPPFTGCWLCLYYQSLRRQQSCTWYCIPVGIAHIAEKVRHKGFTSQPSAKEGASVLNVLYFRKIQLKNMWHTTERLKTTRVVARAHLPIYSTQHHSKRLGCLSPLHPCHDNTSPRWMQQPNVQLPRTTAP